MCVLCDKGPVEDEKHMLMECTFYTDERTVFIQSLQEFSNINFVNTKDTFLTLVMSCHNGDTEFAKAMCLFVTSAFKKRDTVLI